MKIIFLGLLLSVGLHAETFKISGTLQSFTSIDGLLVQGCHPNCEALATVKKFSTIDLKKAREGRPHPNSVGADTCQLIYLGTSVYGVNSDKDQRTFCLFKDGSMIENNSLTDYLKTKKIIKP
jgi:hypothetical protein